MKISNKLLGILDEGRISEFVVYHFLMDEIGDIDPSYPMLRYVCDRFELNTEQRYWLAFLFGATYCSPTVYYIYNEFPDFENVDVGRLTRWWNANKDKTVFQSDRLWIRSRNQFVPMFVSYRNHILKKGSTQEEAYFNFQESDPKKMYDKAYKYFINVKYFGRFSMFLYLESVHVVTGFPLYPDSIDWRNAKSSRNGLCFALGYDDLLRGHGYEDTELLSEDYVMLDEDYEDLLNVFKHLKPDARIDAWNVETSLCAYKKWRLGVADEKRKTSAHYRYPGYYLDRQYDEVVKLESKVSNGVDWNVLWDFRKETYNKERLIEFGGDNKIWSEEELQRRFDLLNKERILL